MEARDAELAVERAEKALEKDPHSGQLLKNLGTAYYRAGDRDAALETLKKAVELDGQTEFSFKAFFIAMSYSRLGNNPVRTGSAPYLAR